MVNGCRRYFALRDGLRDKGDRMDRLPNLPGGAWLGSAWDFAAAHPYICAWLALTSVWALFSFSRRDGA
jgi:hypothetical protein